MNASMVSQRESRLERAPSARIFDYERRSGSKTQEQVIADACQAFKKSSAWSHLVAVHEMSLIPIHIKRVKS